LRQFAVQYFAASVDSAETNRKFAVSLAVDYPILSDPTRDVARAYGVLAANGYAMRRTFYIGADGRILAIDENVSPASHGRDVVAKLTDLGIQRSSGTHDERTGGKGETPNPAKTR
jgi:thioredoxin-dependent peroxiredoxin